MTGNPRQPRLSDRDDATVAAIARQAADQIPPRLDELAGNLETAIRQRQDALLEAARHLLTQATTLEAHLNDILPPPPQAARQAMPPAPQHPATPTEGDAT